MHLRDVGTEVGGYTDGRSIVLAPYWVYNTEDLRSVLLHELQHMVQFAEGFTTGTMPAVMVARLQVELEYYEMELADLSKAEAKTPSEAKALAEAIEVTRTRRDTMARMLEEHRANPYELYLRLAGEIEARNVQARMNMTAAERLAKPFNETLEYRGEAITPITFSLASQERAQRIARGFHDVEGMAAVEVSVPDVYVKDTAKARNAIKAAYDELRKKPVIMQDGSDVRFTGSGLREIKNHSADRRVLSAIVKMRELSAVAKYIDSAPNTQKHIPAKRNIERFHYYLSKGNFPEYKQWEVSNGRTAGDSGDAYVLIVVAEDNNGNKFYDLDATDVEDVEANKGVSEYLEATRVPNAGRQDSSTPKGRIHRIKEYVNYIDSLNGNFAGNNETADTSFSLASETAEGLFEDGVMTAENAVVVAPSFSISAMHVSPHSFRKFSTDYMGTGEGAQVYGWGLYFMTSTGVNRVYHNQFSRAYRDRYTNRINGARVSDAQAIEMIPGLSETAHPSNLLNALRRHDVKRSFVPVVQSVIKEWRGYRASRESVRKDYVEGLPRDEERLERNIANFSDRTKKKKRKEHEEHVALMLRGFDEDIARLGDDLKALEKVLAWAKAGNKLEYKLGGAVHNYRVELNVEDSNLLDWDKPCVTPELREALKELGISDKAGEFNFRYSTGEYVYKELVGHFGEKKAASVWLAALGYKGVKYLDGFSRRKGKGTYNYVVFSGEDVKITAVQSREEWSLRAGWKKYEDETATFSLGMTAEMADIKAAAEAEGTFMKAPNGKPSKLNAVQWMQVRTKAFKRWFGDWENDPANASKVVDENGEPLVVYHGTRSAFTVFDRGKSGESNQYASVGFWFSPIKGFGERFARNSWWGDGEEREMSLFLNVRNPKVFETRADEDYGDAYERFRTDVVALLGKDAEFANIGGRGKAWHKGVNKMGIPDFMSTAEQEAVIDEYREKLKAEGYDGIVIKQTEYDYSTAGSANDQYVVLESAQAKSATDNRGTFDGGNADITYSIIGPSALTWDRYADQAFKGRDDGKLRAEIDSSRARVKDGVFGFDKVKVYRQLIADWGQLPEDERFAVLNYVDLHDEYRSARIAWRDSVGAEAAEAVMRVKHDAAEAAKPAAVAAMESWFAQRGVRLGEEISDNDTMVKLAESFWYGNADSVVELALTSRDNTARLGDVLDYAELYEAYPQLAEMEVVVRDLGGSYLGQVRSYRRPDEHIVMDMRLLGDWGRFRSVLLHEVQHVVQGIEGYAKGGNKESVYEHMKDRLEYNDWQMQMLARELRWLSGLDYAKDYLKSARRLLKYPNAWKYNGLRYKHWTATLDGADVARLMVDDIAGQYEELRQADVVETERRNHVIKEAEYVLPEVDFSDISGIERGLAALAKLKPRRSAFRGEAPKKDKRYVELLRYSQAAKNMLKKYKFEPYELYVRLAGEIEARNVQARMDMTASERVARPFNETLEYPGEALVTFSLSSQMADVMAEWVNTLDGYLQSPPQPGTPEHTRDLVVCPTPAVMQMVGAKGLDMVVTPGVLDKVMKDKHAVTEDALRQLPAALAEPVCIAVSDKPGCLEVITELKEGEHNVLVAVQLNSHQTNNVLVKVNRIASIYGKERIEKLMNHPMLYWDKVKARPWLASYRLQLPAIIHPRRASGKRIQTPADLVKYKMERGLSFSLSGPSMLDAAPTGRMAGEEKMQRLLNYARKEAARWGRTFSKETPNARAAEAMGTVSSLLASIHKELPPMYRPRVESHLRYVEVYARLIESGKIRTYGKLSKAQRAEVEAELMEVLREEQQRVDAEYEQAKAEALQAAALTGEMAALEEAEKMDVEDEVQRAAYLERVAKRAEAEARKRLLAEAEAKKKQLDAEVEALKREFGAEKLGAIAKGMLTDAADSVERYMIDTTLDIVPKLLEHLAPKKLPNGKYDKGKMSADAYRKFVRYVEMIDSTAEEVAERMEALGLQIAAEEAKSDKEKETVDGDKLEALQAELAEWSTYGNLRGKRLESVRAGVQVLVDFAAYEKNAWQGMLQLKRARIKRQALKAAEALGGVCCCVEKSWEAIKKAVNRGTLTLKQPQATSASRFHRTATVTPLERYIKQNDADERKISSKELAKSVGCVMMGMDE